MPAVEDRFERAPALLRYPDREELREVMLFDGRPVAEFDLPAGDGWFDRFELDISRGRELAYRWIGRVQR